MIIGSIVKLKDRHYVVVNPSGALEKLPMLKWWAAAYLEIRQGMGKILALSELRTFCNKNKKEKKMITTTLGKKIFIISYDDNAKLFLAKDERGIEGHYLKSWLKGEGSEIEDKIKEVSE